LLQFSTQKPLCSATSSLSFLSDAVKIPLSNLYYLFAFALNYSCTMTLTIS